MSSGSRAVSPRPVEQEVHGADKSPPLVIFDLDGTLVDSREDIAASINVGLERVGGARRAETEIHPLIGRPLAEMFVALLPPELSHRTPDAATAYRAHYFDNCSRRSRIYPGVAECLAALADVPLAIATTKATFQAERVAEQLGLAPHFELVQGTDGLPFKPDPAVIHLVLDRLRTPGSTPAP
jgi:phosphoglycolate phosphatase